MKTKLLSIVSVIKGGNVMFFQKQLKYIISFLMITLFSLSIMLFTHHETKAADLSQKSPNLTWAQGGLKGLRWGMSKKEVERVLGVRLRLYDEKRTVTDYTTNLTTTWINNVRIGFNTCKRMTGQLSFHYDKLYHIWFCTNRPPLSIASSKFGSGAPNSSYPNDNSKREWWDNKTIIRVDDAGDVWIESWRAADKAWDRDHRDDYKWYLYNWRRQHAK